MKFTALIVSVACAIGFSSCCCQTQPMPKLRAMPKNLVPEEQPGQPGQPGLSGQPGSVAEQPVKVLGSSGK
ncbi:MAG: hypothetical protein J6R92_06655 [Akkermansia sp.]|nr:hypothetical protein [Akkermansia sp.]